MCESRETSQRPHVSSIRPSASRYMRTVPPYQVAMRMATDPAVSSIERDCYQQVHSPHPTGGDSSAGARDSPDLYDEVYDEVGRRLSVQVGAPWGIDRIDTDGGAIDGIFNDGDLTGTGVRVYVVDDGVQGSHVDFGGRVVSGHTVLGPLARAQHCPCPCCDDILRAPSPARDPCFPRLSQAIARPSAPTQHRPTAHHAITPFSHPQSPPSSVPLSLCPSRSLTFAPSAPRAKRSTASSPPTALGAKGTAPTSPQPSAAKCTVSLRA